MRQYKEIPPFMGTNRDENKRRIPDHQLAYSKNIIFKDGKVKRRWGYASLGGNLPLQHGATGALVSYPIQAIAWYDQLKGTATELLCFTQRDSYLYNSSSGNWDFITKMYNTGTASCAAGTTVTGNGTSWKPAGVAIGATGVCAIKFGTNDPNGTGTPDNWYLVNSWTNDTSLELTGNGPNTSGLVNYVIRLCWSGDADDIHSVSIPQDVVGGTDDRLLIVVNGIEAPQKYNASTGYMEDLGGSPNIAKYVDHFYNHTVLAWLNDGSKDLPQNFQISDIGEPEDWSGGSANEWILTDGDDEIAGMKVLQNRLIIYKERSITEVWATGDAAEAYKYTERKIQNIGTPTARTVASFGTYHVFLGWDGIYVFNGMSIKQIGQDINNYLFTNISQERIKRSFALPILEEDLYCLFVPDSGQSYPSTVWVLNVETNAWSHWELGNGPGSSSVDFMTAQGFYKVDQSQTWTELKAAGTTWTGLAGTRWRDLSGTANEYIIVLGDSAGYLYTMDKGDDTDNGTGIDLEIQTKDYPLNDLKHAVKIYEVNLGLVRKTSGNITVQVSTDYGRTYGNTITLDQTGNVEFIERVCNVMLHGKHVRVRIRNIEGADMELENIILGFESVGLTIAR